MIWSNKTYENLDFTFKEKLHFQGYPNKMHSGCRKTTVLTHRYHMMQLQDVVDHHHNVPILKGTFPGIISRGTYRSNV